MTDQQDVSVSRQAIAVHDRSLPGKVTGRLKRALLAMVWEGRKRKDAAEVSRMTDHSLRAALKRPHVMAFYLKELEVLRTSERARSIFRLTELREQDSNKMAAVNAIKALEQITDEPLPLGGRALQPGVTIVIGSMPPDARTIGPHAAGVVIDMASDQETEGRPPAPPHETP